MFKRYDLVIINRSFWPVYPVIGEALLRLAENLPHSKKVAVVMQDHDNIKDHLKKNNRGLGIKFFSSKAYSNSSSSLIIRILDAIFFTFWVKFCILITRPKNIYIFYRPTCHSSIYCCSSFKDNEYKIHISHTRYSSRGNKYYQKIKFL